MTPKLTITKSSHLYYDLSIEQFSKADQCKLRADFDWIDSCQTLDWDEATFLKYRGEFYCPQDMEHSSVPGYDGIVTETYFSGVLFKYDSDANGWRIASYYC